MGLACPLLWGTDETRVIIYISIQFKIFNINFLIPSMFYSIKLFKTEMHDGNEIEMYS